jgi:hypothetical protein
VSHRLGKPVNPDAGVGEYSLGRCVGAANRIYSINVVRCAFIELGRNVLNFQVMIGTSCKICSSVTCGPKPLLGHGLFALPADPFE